MLEDICCRKCEHSELTFDENSDEILNNQEDKSIRGLNEKSGIQTEQVKKIKIVAEATRENQKPSVEIKNPARKIERIIIFYSDKTCTEYKLD